MKKRIWIIGLLIVAIGAGWFFWSRHQKGGSEQAGGPGGAKGGRGGPGGPVPVLVDQVKAQDVPIYLDGLGTVQAFNSVVVRSRIEGQLDKIAFTEGDEVKEGDLLAIIDPRPIESQLTQAQARMRQDEAQLQNAQSIFNRNSELVKKGVLDRQTFETSRSQVDQLQATVQSDAAAVENAKTQLSYTRIVSPINGRVGVRQVDQGNIVRANDQNGLVTITQMKPITVVFTLPEQNLQSIFDQAKDPEKLTVSVLDRSNTKTLAEGVLAVIDNQIDPGTGTVRLKATFQNENMRLWPGQFVNARLLLTTRKDGAVVPTAAVQRGPNGTYVYVVNADKTAEMRPVKVGPSEGNVALIDSGLKVGEQVVVDGQYKLQPGSKVEFAAAPPSAGGRGDGALGKGPAPATPKETAANRSGAPAP